MSDFLNAVRGLISLKRKDSVSSKDMIDDAKKLVSLGYGVKVGEKGGNNATYIYITAPSAKNLKEVADLLKNRYKANLKTFKGAIRIDSFAFFANKQLVNLTEAVSNIDTLDVKQMEKIRNRETSTPRVVKRSGKLFVPGDLSRA